MSNGIWALLQGAMQVPSFLGAWQSLQKSSEIFDKWQRQTQPGRYRQGGWSLAGGQTPEDVGVNVTRRPTWVQVGVNDFLAGLTPGYGSRRAGEYPGYLNRPELMLGMGRTGAGSEGGERGSISRSLWRDEEDRRRALQDAMRAVAGVRF